MHLKVQFFMIFFSVMMIKQTFYVKEMSISLDDERTLTMVQDVDDSDLIPESSPVPVQEGIIEAGCSQGMEGAILQGISQ